ncbi:L,D-transpeptidase [Pseudonocardia sp.]|uniref:L,D-transpeptidase n=1 Tax=Pseudonocardia sp. TaxID=60912 RepID=UPI003D0F56D2
MGDGTADGTSQVGGSRMVVAGRRPPKRSLLVGALALLGVVLVASGTAVGGTVAEHVVAAEAAEVQVSPGDSVTDVAPSAPASVEVEHGRIETIELIGAEGHRVAGTLSADADTWRPDEPLDFDTTYTWSGWAVGDDGERSPIAGSFATVKPKKLVKARLNVADGETYGVAMPIAVDFSAPIVDAEDKAAVEERLSVRTSKPVEGSWAWLSDTSVHWRPKEYYPADTEVTVSAPAYGVDLGDGAYGRNDVTSTFTIGRQFVLRGDTREYMLHAFSDGVQVGQWKASYGLDSDPRRVTHSGIHVAMTKHAKYLMNSETFGYTDFPVSWAVRISNNGEFTHAAPWSASAQGRRNVSHGCINLSMADAKAVYDAVITGDPVEITGSSQQLDKQDGNYYDWTVPWDEWTAKSALTPSS